MKNNPYSVRGRGKNHIRRSTEAFEDSTSFLPFHSWGFLAFLLRWILLSDVEVLCTYGLISTYYI